MRTPSSGSNTSSRLVGRDDEIETVLSAYRGTAIDLVVIAGAAGVGKSHLAWIALETMAAGGAPVRRAICTAPMQQIPYASIATIAALSADANAGADDGSAAAFRMAAAARAALCTVPRTALSIDDIDLLDEPSAGLLAQLAGNDRLFLVATMRSGCRLPEALRSLAQTDRCRWIDLQALDRAGSRALVEAILDAPVDGASDLAIWAVSQGNPLYIRELVAASVESGVLHSTRGTFTVSGPLASGRRLRDLVERRLGNLDHDERELAQLLALCQPVAAALLPPPLLAAAERLEHSGHVTVESGASAPAGELAHDPAHGPIDELVDGAEREALAWQHMIRLSHPIYGEVIAESMSRLGRQRLLREHLVRLGDSHSGTIDDDMSRAVLELAAGVTPDGDRLIRAAKLARQAPEFRLVAQLALAAIEHGVGGADADLLLADALYELGEHEASRDVHLRALAATTDEFVIMLFATSAHRVYLWGLDSPDEGVALLRECLERVTTPVLQAAIRSAEMNVLAFSDRAVEALQLDAHLPSDSYLVEEIAAVSRCIALTCVGRAHEALLVSRDAEATQVLQRDPRAVLHPIVHQICRSFVHAELGELDEAIADATQAYEQFVTIQMPLNETWSAINAARAHLFAGSLGTARRWAEEAAAAADRGNVRSGSRLALMVSAICAAQLGHPTGALLDQLHALPEARGFFGVEMPVAEAWCLQGLGRVSEAREVLLAGVRDAAARGLVSSEVFLVHECARAGSAEAVAARARQLIGCTSSSFAHARMRHVLALAGGDPVELESAADELEAMGALLLAAEAAAVAAQRFAAAGNSRRAATAKGRAHRLAARCEGATTPSLRSFESPTPLTDRESEIALLAARGLTSRAIAEQLVVSVRTVENHLQRVYMKLGVTGRADLASALG